MRQLRAQRTVTCLGVSMRGVGKGTDARMRGVGKGTDARGHRGLVRNRPEIFDRAGGEGRKPGAGAGRRAACFPRQHAMGY